MSRRITARASSGANPVLPPTLVLKSTVDATVSTDAVVDRLLKHLKPNRHELVLFDINRFAAKTSLLIADPEHCCLDLEPGSSLDHLQAASVSYRLAIGLHARRKALNLCSDSRLSGTLD